MGRATPLGCGMCGKVGRPTLNIKTRIMKRRVVEGIKITSITLGWTFSASQRLCVNPDFEQVFAGPAGTHKKSPSGEPEGPEAKHGIAVEFIRRGPL